ncbi:hypothetical protein [Novosphingobium sp. UBA1939]|uniref:hypothetical protein n=1 Tax=Novosphingobium sp. UBA1939 TaxID=1946982 RepID=UPI0025E5D7FB|nr:hypothetical protein [Novosphingobium sp. UBA1939]
MQDRLTMKRRVHRFFRFPVPRGFIVWAVVLSFLASAVDLFAPLETFRFLSTIPFKDRDLDHYLLVEDGRGAAKRSESEQRLLVSDVLKKLDEADPSQIVYYDSLDQPSSPEADTRLGDTIARLKRPVIALLDVYPEEGYNNDGPTPGWLSGMFLHLEAFPKVTYRRPLPQFQRNVHFGNALTLMFFRSPGGSVSPWLETTHGRIAPIPYLVAGRSSPSEFTTPVNPNISTRLVRRVSLSDVVAGRIAPRDISGRIVIISNRHSSDWIEYGTLAGSGYVQASAQHLIVQIETLRRGLPRQLGWLPIWLVALAIPHLLWALKRRPFKPQDAALFSIAATLSFVVLTRWNIEVELFPGILLAWVYAALMRWKLDVQHERLIDSDTGLANRHAFAQEEKLAGTLGVCSLRVACLDPGDDLKSALQSTAQRLLYLGSTTKVFLTGPDILSFYVGAQNIHNVRDVLCSASFESRLLEGSPRNAEVAIHAGVAFSGPQDLPTALLQATEAAQSAYARRLPFAIARSAEQRERIVGTNVTSLRPYRPVLSFQTGHICGAEFTQCVVPDSSDTVMAQIRLFLAGPESGNCHFHDLRLWLNIDATVLDDLHLWDDVSYYLSGKPDLAQRLTLGVDRLETVARGSSRDNQLLRLRKLGIECSLLGLGANRGIDFATLRRLRATQMKLSETFSGYGYIAGERLLRASGDLGRELGRTLFIPNLVTQADLAAAQTAGMDYGVGRAVGEVMTWEELVTAAQQQQRVS